MKKKSNEFHVQMKDNCCYHWTLIERLEELKKELVQVESDIKEDEVLRKYFSDVAQRKGERDATWTMTIHDEIPEWFSADYFEVSILSIPDFMEGAGNCISRSLIVTAFKNKFQIFHSTMRDEELESPKGMPKQKAMVNQLSLSAKRFIQKELMEETADEKIDFSKFNGNGFDK